MKALIADDEPSLRGHLRQQLATLWPELEICAEVADGQSALRRIQEERPDIAFLDIRMPGLDGIEVAREITYDCQVVFVTAYDDYAIEAFEQHAVDYLLKPFTTERLAETIRRLQRRPTAGAHATALQAIYAQLRQTLQDARALQWIRASQGGNVYLINIDDVIFIRSGDKYTRVKTGDGEYLIRTPLKELESRLDPGRFWRIHRSLIVNVGCIERATRTLDGRYQVKLRGVDERLTASRAYAHLFRQM